MIEKHDTLRLAALARCSLVALLAGIGSWHLNAATITAAGPNRAQVLAAYNLTANGDTLVIPAGTSTPWTDQLIVAKNLTIKGAGKFSTILVNGIPTTDWHGRKPIFYVTASGTWRITGIGFNGQNTSGGKGVVVVGGNGRINDCYFLRCYDRGIQTFVPAGLIDHCLFVDCFSSASFYADQYNAWVRPLNIGTTNCWVFEDNYDRKTGAVSAPIGSDGGWGARYVWRYNTFSNQAPSGCDYALDAHGNQGKPFGDPSLSIAGTVFLESYNNTFSMGNANRGNILRGGTQLHYNNRYFATGGNILSFNTVFVLSEEDGYRFGSPIRTAWPGYQQITNSYFWANSWNGATNPAPMLEFPGTTPCLNTNGCGAPWPSDGIFMQEGRDYWRAKPTTNFYVPLTYPHPRVIADNDPPIPAAFALFAPSNGQTGFGLTDSLGWVDTTGETSYRVIVSRDRFFSDVVWDVAASANATEIAVPVGVLTTDTTYFWLVRAVNANGVITSTGAPWTFTTGAAPTFPPLTPSNVSPADGSGGASLTVTLQGSAYSDPQGSAHAASQFQVYDGNGVGLIHDSGTRGAVTSYAVPTGNLTYLQVYSWRVRYQNALGLWSDYSPLTIFATLSPSPPVTPTNLSPANGTLDVVLSPTLTASAYSDPQSSAHAASQWQLFENGTNIVDSGEWIPTVTYAVPIVLSNNLTYSWQVRYKNSFDLWSAYSAETFFSTTNSVVEPPPPPPPPPPPDPVAPNTPSNVSPANNALNVTLTPELVGSAYSDPQNFPQSASQWLLLHLGTNLLDSGVYAATNTYPVTNALESLATYSWQFRYRNTAGLWSSYSTPTFFTTTNVVIPPPPPPPSTNPPTNPPPNPPPPTNAPTRTNIVIFRGVVELRGYWSSE